MNTAIAILFTAAVIIFVVICIIIWRAYKDDQVQEVPCRNCGSTGGMVFKRDEPRGWLCRGCGKRMDGMSAE